MSELWPRLSAPLAKAAFEEMGNVGVAALADLARLEHSHETYAATGGARVTKAQLKSLASRLRATAEEFGYPQKAGDDERVRFDRAAAEVIFTGMNLTTVEAANRGVWSFLAIVALPDLTEWRFGRNNLERWIASDLTRHMFSRLWWQALTFAEPLQDGEFDFRILRRLTESDLNQIMERRALAGNVRLARVLAKTLLTGAGTHREMVRTVTPKLRRRLAFIDYSVLNDEQIEDQIRALL